MKKHIGIALAAALLLVGCNKDEGAPDIGDNVPVQFSTAITKAAGATWGATDEIGVFMMNNGTPLTTERLADNVKLATTNGTDFTLATPIYYPKSGNVDFVAYYPYKATFATPYTYKVNVSTQTTPADIDLLWSNNAKSKSRSKTAVGLEFKHALSRVLLNITKGEGMDAIDFSTLAVTIKGMPTTADFALANGSFSNLAGAATDITPRTITAGTTYEAIVIPQAGGTGRSITFTVDGETCTYALPNADDFAGGKNYLYTITVSNSGVMVMTVSRGAISDWNTTTPEPVTPIQMPDMVLIPRGTFMMGSPSTDTEAHNSEMPQHWVKLTKDFYMSKYQITNVQYAEFLNAEGIASNGRGIVSYDEGGIYYSKWQTFITANSSGLEWDTDKWVVQTSGFENYPVIYVTWYGAKAFADWIGGSLPTEAQWEYACRAGTTTVYSYGDVQNSDYMWYQNHNTTDDGERYGTQAVGRRLANPWGLYDMHGNVWEWCLDEWDGRSDNYPIAATEGDAVENPLVTAGTYRVMRGGSWESSDYFLRSAFRKSFEPHLAYTIIGFRVVLFP